MKVAVIGIGNPTCGDDAVGPWVASRIREDLGDDAARFYEGPCEPARLIEILRDSDRAFVIDACEFVEGREPTDSTHGFDLAWTLDLARALGAQAEVSLHAIEGRHFEPGDPMGEDVRVQALALADRLIEEVRRCRLC